LAIIADGVIAIYGSSGVDSMGMVVETGTAPMQNYPAILASLTFLKWVGLILAGILILVLAGRSWMAWRSPGLSLWHTFVPDEPSAKEIESMTWSEYLAMEEDLFASMQEQVTKKLDSEPLIHGNRYFSESPLHPPSFETDWNRSFLLMPEGTPVGTAVLVHGLTDSPFSMRHLAAIYRDRGFAAMVVRMPGHGTVPGALTKTQWPDWMAATKMAVREVRKLAGPDTPLHLAGYSNGGALVTKYSLESLQDSQLARPDQLVLLSPMIGLTRFARFARIAGLPAVLPAFVRAAWLEVVPEFNPFKYNSFPVQAAVQAHYLTRALHRDFERLTRNGTMAEMPPVLTVQSVVDSTVSTRAIVQELYERLPKNGSELVLIDINRAAKFHPAFQPSAEDAIDLLLPPAPRDYQVTVISNAGPDQLEVVARIEDPGTTTYREEMLHLPYPRDVFSLSHVAIPFPAGDGLYGEAPNPEEDFGVHLGTLASRGEAGVLTVSVKMFARMYWNPFFQDLQNRLEKAISPQVVDKKKARSPEAPEQD